MSALSNRSDVFGSDFLFQRQRQNRHLDDCVVLYKFCIEERITTLDLCILRKREKCQEKPRARKQMQPIKERRVESVRCDWLMDSMFSPGKP